jgi:hypothetical protein
MGKKVKITRIVDVTEMGRAGGLARAANLSDAELSAAGSKAVKARWEAYYAAHPERRATARTKQSRISVPASSRKKAVAKKKSAK